MSKINTVAVTGATGLIGSALVGQLKSDGYEVKKLVRRPIRNSEEVFWNPTLGEINLDALAETDAIIHLAGAGVGDKRWSAAYKSEILNSRLLGTTTIAKAANELGVKRFISASAIGYYGETGNRAVTVHDQIRAINFLLNSKIAGAVNLTAPNPVTNQEFTAALARAMHRPAIFPAPAFALRLALGGFSTEILGSKKVLPKALLDAGFEFDYPHVSSALTALVD